MTLLGTERLVLETLTVDEARAISSGDRSGRAWADDYPSDGDLVVAGIAVEAGEHYDESVELGILQVRRRDTGLAIGGIGFISAPDGGEIEVGYGLVESARGQGLASEALAAVVALARSEGVTRMVAHTDVDNEASQGVLVRAGFQRTGRVESAEGVELVWSLDLV